ncbi:MAG: ARC6/PARC6 family protein [Gloeomargarita sp. SKYG116]|nr:ARC6/PARC6 family protein [Gloeomargarita sp. SKYG116]MDW8400993.1 ARC6/PARC6 family protein [Gloeomargarita sp. SKYGB_i_bin116]
MAAISYRQILLERDGQPLSESQVTTLLQQVLAQLQSYHDHQQAHGDVNLSTIHQTSQGCFLAPPTRISPTATPQQDVVALARAAITLLTGYPPTKVDASWQDLCPAGVTPLLKQTLQRMLAGEFFHAGQVLAVLAPAALAPTEVMPVLATRPQPDARPSQGVLLLILGLSLGVIVGGGAILFVLSRPGSMPSDQGTQPVATPTPASGGGGSKVAVAPSPPSVLTEQEALALVEAWLEAKKTIFAPPYDLDLAANFLTGPAWHDVSKPNGSVDWLRKNQVYYRYGDKQIRLLRVLSSTPDQMVLDVAIQEELSMYRQGRLRQRKIDRDTYRFDLRRVEDTWKIYDRRSVR